MSASIVVTVHGTNDGAAEDDGGQWWQRNSAFCQRVQADAAAAGATLEWRPFHWDGANSDVSRRAAGKQLAETLKPLLHRRDGGAVSVIGHSHGGNVIVHALDDPFLWRAHRCGALRIISVGTPFLLSRPRVISLLNAIVQRLFVTFGLLIVLAFGLVVSGAAQPVLPFLGALGADITEGRQALLNVASNSRAQIEAFIVLAREADADYEAYQFAALQFGADALALVLRYAWVLIVAALAGLALAWMRPLGSARAYVAGLAAARRWRERAHEYQWTTLSHPADEAIGLLQTTRSAQLRPMTTASAARSVRRGAPLAAFAIACLMAWSIWTEGDYMVLNTPQDLIWSGQSIVAQRAWNEHVEPLAPGLGWSHSSEFGLQIPELDLDMAAAGDRALRAELVAALARANAAAETERARLDALYERIRVALESYMGVILFVMTVGALILVWLGQLLLNLLSPLLGRITSFAANRSVTGAMVGAALGEDGEHVIQSVSVAPPARIAANAVQLSEAAIEQMFADADNNAGESLRRMRRAIRTARAETTGDALSDMLKHISWRELIHTSYFESEEVVRIVAAQLSERATAAQLPAAAAAV
ncbi:MAG: hypothetical protein AB7P07_01185 [Hyphomonadaceae bacterium]